MHSRTDHYRKTFTADDAPGLDAIIRKEKSIYHNIEPTHWATVVPLELGGEDPLWAVDCFESEKQQTHFHYISLGFTNLFYDERFAEDEVNGFGFELTFRHLPFDDDPEKPVWPVNLFQNMARYVFKTNNVFELYQRLNANGPIRLETDSAITAVVFVPDAEMGEIKTPHGSVMFLQIFGITSDEYADLKNRKYSTEELIEKHRAVNPLLITDLGRK